MSQNLFVAATAHHERQSIETIGRDYDVASCRTERNSRKWAQDLLDATVILHRDAIDRADVGREAQKVAHQECARDLSG